MPHFRTQTQCISDVERLFDRDSIGALVQLHCTKGSQDGEPNAVSACPVPTLSTMLEAPDVFFRQLTCSHTPPLACPGRYDSVKPTFEQN